jgi:hypothetical protein
MSRMLKQILAYNQQLHEKSKAGKQLKIGGSLNNKTQ